MPAPTASPTPSSSPTPLEPTPLERPTIVSIEAEGIDLGGYPALKVTIYGKDFPELLSVLVMDENGAVLDTDQIEPRKRAGDVSVVLKVGGYHETLPESTFIIVVSDEYGEVKRETFNLESAALYIGGFELGYTFHEYTYFPDTLKVDFIKYSLINHGDLPAYPDFGKLIIYGKELSFTCYDDKAAVPGKCTQYLEDVFMYIDDAEGGGNLVTLKIFAGPLEAAESKMIFIR